MEMDMANITREERQRREAEAESKRDADRKRAYDEALARGDSFGMAAVTSQETVDLQNELDERLPDRRPATLVNVDTQEQAPDNRAFAGDEARALNQMAGRAAQTWNADPLPGPAQARPDSLPDAPGEGEEDVLLTKGYQPGDGKGAPKGDKMAPGHIVRVARAEARRLINAGAAKFVDR
jgi:hypothetical protein